MRVPQPPAAGQPRTPKKQRNLKRTASARQRSARGCGGPSRPGRWRSGWRGSQPPCASECHGPRRCEKRTRWSDALALAGVQRSEPPAAASTTSWTACREIPTRCAAVACAGRALYRPAGTGSHSDTHIRARGRRKRASVCVVRTQRNRPRRARGGGTRRARRGRRHRRRTCASWRPAG